MTVRVRDVKSAALREIKEPIARDILRGIADYPALYEGINTMLKRVEDFPNPTMAFLAGVAVDPAARRAVDAQTSSIWERNWSITSAGIPDEVVIGSGPHALIYAAIRKSMGVNVVVLEKNNRVGGMFACSAGDAFYLNSRNRPGEVGLPGEGKGLNVLPGVPLQPAMVGGGEYQTNADLAWTIRMNFLLAGIEVHTGVEVSSLRERRINGKPRVELNIKYLGANYILNTKRVMLCTGLGEATPFLGADGPPPQRVLSFAEFMAKMDQPFPLQGMKNVAVIGAGDSGKTVVESLLGMGPTTGMSVAGLDFVQSIDWYGCAYSNQTSWCQGNRGRYNRIGKALGNRVRPLDRARLFPTDTYEKANIGPRAYDWVINCTGFSDSTPLVNLGDFNEFKPGGRPVAKRFAASDSEIYLAGPAARIALTDRYREMEPGLAAIPQNTASIFRYAPMTASLAYSMPKVA